MVQPIVDAFVNVPSFLAWFPSTGEWIIIAAFGLLLFGKRLPEVGRSLGKGIVEFKKGLKGVEDEVDHASTAKTDTQPKFDPSTGKPQLPAGAKFDPYTGKPVEDVKVDQNTNAASATAGMTPEPGKAV